MNTLWKQLEDSPVTARMREIGLSEDFIHECFIEVMKIYGK